MAYTFEYLGWDINVVKRRNGYRVYAKHAEFDPIRLSFFKARITAIAAAKTAINKHHHENHV